jgi:hypothetical protein
MGPTTMKIKDARVLMPLIPHSTLLMGSGASKGASVSVEVYIILLGYLTEVIGYAACNLGYFP